MTDEKDKKKSSDNGEEKKKSDVRDTGAHTPESKRTSSNPPSGGAKKPRGQGDEPKEEEEKEEQAPPKKAAAKKEEKKPAKKEEPPRKPWVNFFPARELPKHGPEVLTEKKPTLMLAEFDSPGRALHAAERLRDAGYTKFDAHSPFPIHGMDAAMGMSDSKLGWIVLCGGLTGLGTAVLMIYWMNGVDYPLIIGGKPPFSLPPSVPIMFELTILFSAFSALFGMLHLNRLPRHHHPIFDSERFAECSDDKFFISIDVDDPKYHAERTRALLDKVHPVNIEVVEEKFDTIIAHETEEDH